MIIRLRILSQAALLGGAITTALDATGDSANASTDVSATPKSPRRHSHAHGTQ